MFTYSKDFFRAQEAHSRLSGQQVVPWIVETFHPKQVIDVGCGVGTWLAVFREYGVTDICGIDGPWVQPDMLQIPADCFSVCDLARGFSQERQFDLVVSLEVAEHLPPESAEAFVDSLVRLGPTILFSAAVPFQGGTNHINEQWPDYWARLFQARGYLTLDIVRERFWRNSNVEWWYAQNMLLFGKPDSLARYGLLDRADNCAPALMVHPELYRKVVGKYLQARAASDPANMGLKKLLSLTRVVLRNTLQRRLSLRRRTPAQPGSVEAMV